MQNAILCHDIAEKWPQTDLPKLANYHKTATIHIFSMGEILLQLYTSGYSTPICLLRMKK